MSPREYMTRRLQLLFEGGALVGTVQENLERHDQAYADLLRLRAEHESERSNLDLIS